MPKYQVRWRCKKECGNIVDPLTSKMINGNDIKPHPTPCPKGGFHQWLLASWLR